MENIRLGVIGYGNMGTTHCKNAANGLTPNLVLTAICDISEARRNVAKENHGDVAIFDNYKDLLKSGLCDLVIVATPHYDHPKMVADAFAEGLHVICEKPAGVYTKQVLEMNEAAEKSGKVFSMMYNQRTNPVYQKVREMVQKGELGHIKRISWIITDWYRPQAYHDSSAWRSSWEQEGGGTLINQNPHQLDLWQWMFGMPDQITAFASFGKYYDIEVEDDVTAFFQYNTEDLLPLRFLPRGRRVRLRSRRVGQLHGPHDVPEPRQQLQGSEIHRRFRSPRRRLQRIADHRRHDGQDGPWRTGKGGYVIWH